MKYILIVLLCLLFTLSVKTQTTSEVEKTEQEIETFILAKENSEGNIIEDIEILGIKDIPLHCYIDLTLSKPTLIKIKVIAVKVKRLRKNSKVIALQYKTKNDENGAAFSIKPSGKFWNEGNYRIEVYLDKKLAESKNFAVKKSKSK